MRLILASASPRRAELLATAGFEFDVRAVDVDERARANESPADYVCRLASEKSARALDLLNGPATAGHYSGAGSARAGPHRGDRGPRVGNVGSGFSRIAPDDLMVLGADTVVVVDGEILGKPADDDLARAMLRRLSGRSHQVMTGVSLRSASREIGGLETTAVWFATLEPEEIEWYVGTGEGRDKAGAYAIQGRASRFIPRIEGSYSNVVGLPVALVNAMIARISSG